MDAIDKYIKYIISKLAINNALNKKEKDTINKSKAKKLSNYGRPTHCSNCSKLMKPDLHLRIFHEGFSITEMSKLYKDKCEWCGNEFEYWK